jgi:cytoskeletal protein CcmA (bactofilin family)
MPQPSESQKSQLNPTFSPTKTVSVSAERATIGRSLIIKGEVSGTESLYIDGRIEGTVDFAGHCVTIGSEGSVAANISAREVVVLGKVQGNIQCADRLDIRSEGSLTGDVVTQRISVEDGAILEGSVQIRAVERQAGMSQQAQAKQASAELAKPATTEQPKAIAAAVGSHTSFPAARQEVGSTFVDRARMLIKGGYKPKDAVELVLQDIALECRNDPSVMQKGHADAEDFLLKIRKGLI